MTTSGLVQNIKSEATRVGYGRALQRSFHSIAKKYVQLRHLELIYLTREFLPPLDPGRFASHSSRIATENDLFTMREQGEWNITDELMAGFLTGDKCLLSFVDNNLGGYTWVHSGGRPEIVPGLRIRIPDDYIYNFAAFTHPSFRGMGLQSFRHHEILARTEWSSRTGMIGYVERTNWSSKKGQSKSGYQSLDHLTLLGYGERLFARFPEAIENFGIQRIHD
jgi:hypothetical protein